MKCSSCGGPLREIDFSKIPEVRHNPRRHGRAYECAKCGDIQLDANTSARLRRELRPTTPDKAIKIDGQLWERVRRVVRERGDEYPSMKFFAQRAIQDHLKRVGP